jgi:hypothetical protein
MLNNRFSLLIIAKYINQEILTDELLHSRSLREDDLLLKFKEKKKRVRIKIIFTKLYYAIIFGILPVIPLIAYFDIQNQFIADRVNLNIIIFGSNLLYSFFFIMQILNIIFMGMIEISRILSNDVYSWLETLPISTKELKRLKLLTIFRSFDLPIIVIIFAFPTVILIGTGNVLIFFFSLGISFLQIIFTFNILIFLGSRISQVLNLNIQNSRKVMVIRLVNVFGFLILFFGSLFFVQWAVNSIDSFFTIPLVQRHPAPLNLILSTIPYPFSPSYLISINSITTQFSYHYNIAFICGIGLFIIFQYWLSRRSLKILSISISSKGGRENRYDSKEITTQKIYINIKKPIMAYLLKDIKLITRNIEAFLLVITPIAISFVFTYTFNFTVLGAQPSFTTDAVYNFSVILAFQPIVCGMVIYNLTNIDRSGESVLVSLPITPKDQAKSKLYYFLVIQTLAIISPYLIYILEPQFIDLFISVLISLPFGWIFLISMFELYIFFFGKKKNRYVLQPVKSENKVVKWIIIYLTEYSFYMSIILLRAAFYNKGGIYFYFNFIEGLLVCFIILYIIFEMLFVPILKTKEKKILKREV